MFRLLVRNEAGVSAYGICQEKSKETKGRRTGKCQVQWQVQIPQTGCIRASGREANGELLRGCLDAAESRRGAFRECTDERAAQNDRQERAEERENNGAGGNLKEQSGGTQKYRKEGHDSGDAQEQDGGRPEGRGGSHQECGAQAGDGGASCDRQPGEDG
ncbi:MAG: hypothetical protein JO004_10300 [Methylobacteriaceae bacterium]|nr:hypothetical protein [Methylobacteriaceae bacterium]